MKSKILGLLVVAMVAAPFTISAASIGLEEQLFNFDLRSNVPSPPYSSIQFSLTFAASDPVTDPDSLLIRLFGNQDGVNLLGNVNFPNFAFGNGGTTLIAQTANAIYDPMLDGVFSIGLSMLSGTAELNSIDTCGLQNGLCSVATVPEPGTFALLGLGLLGLGMSRRKA